MRPLYSTCIRTNIKHELFKNTYGEVSSGLVLTPTFLSKSPTMFSADILVEGVNLWVPVNVVCIGVPWGEGFALIRGDVSMGTVGVLGS